LREGWLVKIYYNPERPITGIEGMIQFAAWEWSLRTGARIEYVGHTAQQSLPDAVVVRMSNSAEWLAILGFTPWSHGAFATTSDKRSFVIGINPFIPSMTLGLMVHEIGHCITIDAGHSTDPDDIMYPNVAANLGITTNDMLTRTEVGGGMSAPAIDEPNRLCAVMMPNMDVWHPDITGPDGKGYQGYLTFAGREDGQIVADLTSYAPNPRSQGNSPSYFDPAGNVLIHELRTPDTVYRNARFTFLRDQRWALAAIE
jgi:hypothetical protein